MSTSAANGNRSMDAVVELDPAFTMPVTEAEWMLTALHDPDVNMRRLAIRTLCVMRATEALNRVKL